MNGFLWLFTSQRTSYPLCIAALNMQEDRNEGGRNLTVTVETEKENNHHFVAGVFKVRRRGGTGGVNSFLSFICH